MDVMHARSYAHSIRDSKVILKFTALGSFDSYYATNRRIYDRAKQIDGVLSNSR